MRQIDAGADTGALVLGIFLAAVRLSPASSRERRKRLADLPTTGWGRRPNGPDCSWLLQPHQQVPTRNCSPPAPPWQSSACDTQAEPWLKRRTCFAATRSRSSSSTRRNSDLNCEANSASSAYIAHLIRLVGFSDNGPHGCRHTLLSRLINLGHLGQLVLLYRPCGNDHMKRRERRLVGQHSAEMREALEKGWR